MLGALSLCFSSCASFEAEKANEARTIEISFDANKTTGYMWVCAIDKTDIAQLIDEKYEIDYSRVDKNGICGAGGEQKFTILCKKKGHAIIRFSYIRPWEKEKKPEKEICYDLRVRENFDYRLEKCYEMSLSDIVSDVVSVFGVGIDVPAM